MKVQTFETGSVYEHVLANGMRLVIVPTDVRPRVLVQMMYDVGASIEAENEKGLAHLLEHMIFKGTPSLQEGAIWKLAARYGAVMNAFTAWDMTSYFFEVDSNNWKPFVHVLADCMENVLLSSEHLASEVKAVIQELRMRNDNQGIVMYETLLERSLPQDHPYFVPLIGYKKDLGALTSDRLRAFYNKYYVPERATLFVVGDVVVEDVVAEVERNFAHIPASGKTFAPVFTKEYSKTTGFHAILPKHFVKPGVLLAWPVPAAFDELAYVAEMASSVLGEGVQSKLYKRLVDQDQSADAVSCGVMRMLHEAFFMVNIQPREGRADACVAAVHEELAKLMQQPVEQKILSRLVKSTVVQKELAYENPTRTLINPERLLEYIQTGSIASAFTIHERLAAVTPRKVMDFIATHLTSPLMMRVDTVAMNEAQKEAWKIEQLKDQELEQQILASHVRTTPIPENVELPAMYAQAQPIAVPIPRATARVELDNGLKIVFVRNKTSNLCAVLAGNYALQACVPPVENVKTAILRELFLEGAAGSSKNELVDWFDDRGVQCMLGAGVAVCLKQDFEDVLVKLLRVLRDPDFLKKGLLSSIFGTRRAAEAAFEKVKTQYINMYKAMYDEPQSLVKYELSSRRYHGSGFGVSLEELLQALNAFKFAELEELYTRFMNPADRIVSISGNLEVDAVVALVKREMGDLKPLPKREIGQSIAAVSVDNFDVPVSRDQVLLLYSRETEFPLNKLTIERVALDMFGSIFLTGGTSRVFKLREATGICYTAGGSIASIGAPSLERSEDTVFALVSPEKINEACTLFESFVQNMFTSPITQQELDDARHASRSIIANAALGTAAIIRHFMMLEAFKRDESYRQRYLDLLDALTPEIIQEVAMKYGSQGRFTRVRVGNIPKAAQ